MRWSKAAPTGSLLLPVINYFAFIGIYNIQTTVRDLGVFKLYLKLVVGAPVVEVMAEAGYHHCQHLFSKSTSKLLKKNPQYSFKKHTHIKTVNNIGPKRSNKVWKSTSTSPKWFHQVVEVRMANINWQTLKACLQLW